MRERIRDPFWRDVQVVERTGSTNADLVAARGVPEGTVLVAEAQDAGRGRIGRTWTSPPGAGLTFSVLLRPMEVPRERWGWLPLLAGVACVAALPGVDARLKWPNDLLVGPDRKKAAGILAEATGDAVVLGIGLNVTLTADELPPDRPDTTSLALAGAPVLDREVLLAAILDELAARYADWRAGDEDLRAAYRGHCDTLGREVRVSLPAGQTLEGVATDVDAEGRLVVGTTAVAAGDVVHVRPQPGPERPAPPSATPTGSS
ncbi:biotin--[acetyl-CoA-carboxylase] ligase [Cryptosporangium arvum]|uniref:biotin--[acetyl-CoA-carboxylase] ligase n=1 Tax=Cryptosporangium arvum TaxID=80871 RepID=UPI001FDFF8DA|nr:biotin--[acetyl-CoA-carboxylase] ligase [Cryptosporangium arvum]